jgi:kynurenine formamidase
MAALRAPWLGMIGALLASGCTTAREPSWVLDLSHPVPTFQAKAEGADLSRPHAGSVPVPSFGAQAVYAVSPPAETGQGHFYAGHLVLYDHHATHLDAPGHYRNDTGSLEIHPPDQRLAAELGVGDLVGPVVFLDIGERVATELARNGGQPSPDPAVTDFSNDSSAVVGAADIDGLAERLVEDAWIVVHTGWSRFFRGSSLDTSLYINGWNYPGLSKAACDRLIQLEDERGIRINGLMMDNIGIDTGESSGPSPRPWHCHVRGLQRGWKFVENATNLHQLAEAREQSCTLVVGALKHRAGSGGAARVFALCEHR